MQIKGFRIYVVISAVILTLAVLLAVQFLYQKYDVEQPLFKLYSQTKLVDKRPHLEQKDGTVQVTLNVKKTDNLKQAYLDLHNYTAQVMGNTEFTIHLKDNRTPALNRAYYQSQFIIYEALSKGEFARMAEVIQQNAKSVGADALIFIDNNNVYVEFIKGDHYLYEIIPRGSGVKESLTDKTGSGLS